MLAPHSVVWQWHKEVLLILTSNFGSPTLTGAGWRKAGSTVPINAPQIFFNGNDQYYFKGWFVTSGTATITNPSALNTTVVLQSDPTIQAEYVLVSSSMTNTFTTTITTVSNGSTITTTSTGVFAHDQVTVQLQILNSKLNVVNANVTVFDDAGQAVYRGLTDQGGLTSQFQAKPNLIYTIKIQSLTQSYSTKQRFQTSGTYPVDVAGSQPLISLQAVGPYVIIIVVVVVAVAALAVYLNSRKGPSRPKTEWISR
jgi:hypothetical protein